MIVYGIATCDTCKKALKALKAAGVEASFRDVRTEPLSDTELAALVGQFGDRIINKTSTTWRGLSDWLRASEPEEQLRQQPTLMKRPVIRDGERIYLGWDDAVQAAVLG